jgi:hypothetical protein
MKFNKKNILFALLFGVILLEAGCKKDDVPTDTANPTNPQALTEYKKVYIGTMLFLNMPYDFLVVNSMQIVDEQNNILGNRLIPLTLNKMNFPTDLLQSYNFNCIASDRLNDSISIKIEGVGDGIPITYAFKYKPITYRPIANVDNRDSKVETEIKVKNGYNIRFGLVFSK